MNLPDPSPFDSNQKVQLETLLGTLNRDQSLWLSGFLAAQIQGMPVPAASPSAPAPPGGLTTHILFGSESGNAEGLAREAQSILKKRGFTPVVKDLADCSPQDLTGMKHTLLITSTWGDGEPPDAAVPFHEAIMGAEAPRLEQLRFSVCALGDTSYEKFCQTGKDFDLRLEQLGGHRLVDRKDCDVDFDEPFQEWMESVCAVLMEESDQAPVAMATPEWPATPAVAYGKKNPFPAPLKERILLSGRGSNKETLHLEFSLEGSGLSYQPGDSLAIHPQNDPQVVDAILEVTGWNGDDPLPLKNREALPLRQALLTHFDITSLTKKFISDYHDLVESSKLAALLQDKEKLQTYLWGRQIIDLLEQFPARGLSPEQVTGLFRKCPPRLYSIASSLKTFPDEVHLTVAVVRYETHGRQRQGVASSYLADRIHPGDPVPAFITPNKHFKLPEQSDRPIIMVGPGTGIAPFRAFLQERQAVGAKGKNWLFFGDQKYSYDFLYQTEWQEYLGSGLLTRLDLAFSRDQKKKIYVQHRMLEKARDLWSWLEDGAVFYVCGDASRMAHDVHEALIQIAESQGGMRRESAEEYVATLQKDKRYLRDVY